MNHINKRNPKIDRVIISGNISFENLYLLFNKVLKNATPLKRPKNNPRQIPIKIGKTTKSKINEIVAFFFNFAPNIDNCDK
ncbi:hypothetical protein [Mycoplasmopsis gallinacea]|uniref:Uncharacterized protein n=1 Tax=Mycoplasmopsis gallinacea TaxID=29556 RepID=A0A6H0V1S7_9BACT|nr:hypothetical protein [Mycoplasmopsis gallinacea]QIW61928.1 hypothetical protein GOQ20_00365 [Mycoplasmopsis gallinacea]